MASLREKLIEDLHLLLGGGMVDVDLDPAHYDLAVRTAIERYQMRSSNAWEEAFMILTTQVGKDTYFLPRDVIIVRSVYRSGGAGIGIGIATGKAAEAVGRQPEASGKIMTFLILGAGLSEATAIYGLVIAFMVMGK